MTATFERSGELLAYGQDLYGRPDCVEFIARAGEPTIDWVAEAFVTISAWGKHEGVATVLAQSGDESWTAIGISLPFDAMYVVRETEVRLVFGSYARLQPGRRYRLFLAGAVVASPVIRLVAVVRPPEPVRPGRRGFKKVRREVSRA